MNDGSGVIKLFRELTRSFARQAIIFNLLSFYLRFYRHIVLRKIDGKRRKIYKAMGKIYNTCGLNRDKLGDCRKIGELCDNTRKRCIDSELPEASWGAFN